VEYAMQIWWNEREMSAEKKCVREMESCDVVKL